MSVPYQNDIINTLYNATVTTCLTIGYIILGRKLIKFDVGDPSRPDLSGIGKMALAIATAELTKDCLVKNKIIPGNIIHPK